MNDCIMTALVSIERVIKRINVRGALEEFLSVHAERIVSK